MIFIRIFLDQERSETEQKIHEAMEAAAGSGIGQAASGSGQAEASTRKRSGAAADQGKRVSEISRSDVATNFFCFPKRTRFSIKEH